MKESEDIPTETTYEAVPEWVTERVLHEDKTHITGLTKNDPPIMLPNEP